MARIDIENHHNLQSYLLNQKEVELIEAINQLFMFMYVNTIPVILSGFWIAVGKRQSSAHCHRQLVGNGKCEKMPP